MTRMRRTIMLGACLLLTVPAGASAATVDVIAGGGFAKFVAARGEANEVTVSQLDSSTVVVADAAVAVHAGTGCAAVDGFSARCSVNPATADFAGRASVSVDTRDGN